MNTKPVVWIGLCVGAMFAGSCAGAATEPWPVAEQPELKQALERAPVLKTESLGNPVGLYIYDPKLGKVVKDFGAIGPSHPNGAWSRYVMGVDDTHAYVASGMVPAWYLVAVHLEAGEQKVLLESPTERVMDILEQFPGAYARVPQGNGAPDKEYWLYHGEAIPKVNDKPPWPKQASPWDKAVPKPDVYFGQIDPDAEGNATVWYRSREDEPADKEKANHGANTDKKPEELGWKSIRLAGVNTYPHRINPLSVLPDGRLYGTGDDYWPHWVDPSYEYLSLTRRPDGFIWTYLKNVLIRIDPRNTRIHVVGKIDPVGLPTFVGNDLYLSGSEQLRRIRNLAPVP